MSETPETDAFIDALNDDWDYEFAALTTHAKKLERERDEAREALQRRIADWNKACDEQGFLMLECDGHRAKAAQLREALQSVMDWNPKPEPTDRPQTVARFEADMARARKVLEETE